MTPRGRQAQVEGRGGAAALVPRRPAEQPASPVGTAPRGLLARPIARQPRSAGTAATICIRGWSVRVAKGWDNDRDADGRAIL